MEELLRGKMVQLKTSDPQTIAESFSRWSRDSEYSRLLDSNAARPRSVKAVKEWIEKSLEKDPPDFFMFTIHTLDDDRLIGEIGLDGILWNHGESFVGIGLGEHEYWGKGYGTEAMRLILRFGFDELNLYRISLSVFEYNLRAIRSYEKAGFVHEGRHPGMLHRDGKRYAILHMGILRDEWLASRQSDQ